jgi:hypothetical protein
MLYLSAYSPHVVLGLLHEVWNSNKKSGITLGKVSSRTILSVYKKVANELRSGGLVQDFPRGWLVALAKFELGPWHPRTPRWLTVVFSNAEIRVPMPPMRNHGRITQSENQATIFDTGHAVEHIISQHRESRMVLSPVEKSKRLVRELNAIRKVFPDFTLSEDEKFVAWDLGLSAVRERRDQEMLAQAGNPRAKPSGSKDKNRGKKALSKEVSSSTSRSATGDIESMADMDSNALTPHCVSAESESKPECVEVVAPRTVIDFEFGGLRGDYALVVRKIGFSNPHALPPAWYGRSVEAFSNGPENAWQTDDDDSKSPPETRLDVFSRDWPPGPPGSRFRLVDSKVARDPIILPDLIFPNLNADSPQAAFDAWLNFDPESDSLCSKYQEVARRVIAFHNGLQQLADCRITGKVLHPRLCATGYMVLFQWILEQSIAKSLDLRICSELEKSESDYVPIAPIWQQQGGFEHEATKKTSVFLPITPLLNMLLGSPPRGQVPQGHRWVLGWGAVPQTVVEQAMETYNEIMKQRFSKVRLDPRRNWLIHIGRSLAVQSFYESNHRGVVHETFNILTRRTLAPMCSNLANNQMEGGEWLDLSKFKNTWKPESKDEVGVVKRLRSFTTQIHMPSLRLVEQHLFQLE